jgi:hypothetical protein
VPLAVIAPEAIVLLAVNACENVVAPNTVFVPPELPTFKVVAAPKALTVVLTVLNTVALTGPTIAAPSVVAPVTPSVVLKVPEVKAPVVAVVAPTVPLMLILAVPVRFVTTPDAGVPRIAPLPKVATPVTPSVELNVPVVADRAAREVLPDTVRLVDIVFVPV